MWREGEKEIILCRSFTDIDFCVYVRHMDLCAYVRHTVFCVHVEGRKIILVSYLLHIQISVYMFETQVFVCICSSEFLFSPRPFIVSFLWNSLFVFEFSESLSVL